MEKGSAQGLRGASDEVKRRIAANETFYQCNCPGQNNQAPVCKQYRQ